MPTTLKKKKVITIMPKPSQTLKKTSPVKLKTEVEESGEKSSLVTDSKKLKSVTPEEITQTKQSMSSPKTYNEEFIKILGELADLMVRKGEPHRARAYQKAEETIIKYQGDITNPKQLKGLPGIGDTIMTKLEEYVKTGTLAALEKERNDPANILAQVYGIGPKKAKELVAAGIKNIDDLKENQNLLNDSQKIGVKYFEDIQKRIPRDEITAFAKTFETIFNKNAPPGSKFEIVGSYRRGHKTSGDIDIIITNENDNKGAFDLVLDKLIKDKIITHVLSRGKTKSLTLVQIEPDAPIRRVDFLYTSPKEYAFALFYFTGSKIFNTVVRERAVDLGYTLNEHGIHHIKKTAKFGSSREGHVKGPHVDQAFPTEESILNFLGLAYVEPENRIDGRSLVPIKQESPPTTSEEDEEAALLAALEKEDAPALPTIDQSKEISDDDLLAALEASELDQDVELAPTSDNKSKSKKNVTLKATKNNPTELVEKFKKDGILALQVMSEKELTSIITAANQEYYCDGDPIMTDSQYDIIREYVLEKYPTNKEAKDGHAMCELAGTKQKIKLPYELWSMDKIKPNTDALGKWLKKYKGPYVVSAKLDGISALYVDEDGKQKLYTRGNGTHGQDISHLIPFLIREPAKNVAIRGEIIIAKEVFDKKYSKKFANSRNFVAGMVNKKTIDANVVKDLDFVPYEVINPTLSPSEQMKYLDKIWTTPNAPKTVIYKIEETITNEMLSQLLLEWRETYQYDIDGVIVVNDKIYSRSKGNPEHAFAFKMVISDQVAEAKVIDVIWTPSKDGYLTPRVQIEPVVLGGATIKFATGKNAKYIVDNKIGIGAIITIVRSGDVIPDIVNVVEPAEPKLPSEPYKWNTTHVDFILDNKDDNDTVKEKNIVVFFKNLGVEGLGPGNVRRLIEANFDTVAKIIAMTKSDFLKVDGFKQKTADKLYEGIHSKLQEITLPELMTASNVFGRGFGDKTFVRILDMYPELLVSGDSEKEKIQQLLKVDGVAKKTAEKFVKHIPDFITFLTDANLDYKLFEETESADIDKSHVLYGKKIVMTGFRDKELVAKLKEVGAENSTAVTKNTFVVIVKDDIEEDTGKADAARQLNIPIITKDDFIKKYF